MIKQYLISEKNIKKNTYFWNMIGSLLMAFQSVIFLVVITRISSLENAGIFSFAYANANLFMTIGKYGMRNFQVSDVKEQFSFNEYKTSRLISSLAMVITFLIYTFYIFYFKGNDLNKVLIVLVMCLNKLIDVYEDIYYGMYQQQGRLDIASKALALRLAIMIISFVTLILITRDLLLSLTITTLFSACISVYFIKICNFQFVCNENEKSSKEMIILLLKKCFPLFLGSFLSFYIGNAPKYAIDNLLNDELQACYGFISMPIFIIGLLNGFIFNPMITKLSKIWYNADYRNFNKTLRFQILIVLVITGVCMLGAYLVGIPVLSFLYNTNLYEFKWELIILLFGGGMLALTGLLNIILTIIRFQKTMVFGYVFVSIISFLLSPILVEKFKVTGATILYLLLMSILFFFFLISYLIKFTSVKKNKAQ